MTVPGASGAGGQARQSARYDGATDCVTSENVVGTHAEPRFPFVWAYRRETAHGPRAILPRYCDHAES